MALAHSYSSVKQFENCPRQYHHIKILKDFKSEPTEATLYGTAVHKAFEEYILHRTPLPPQFAQFERYINPLAAIEGEIKCEEKMGIRADFSPCGFFDKDVWFRGVPDFMAINRDKRLARVADFKTGKSSRYADKGQLELMAAMIMSHYPEVDTVKGALLFVVVGDIIRTEFTRAHLPDIFSRWAGRAGAIEKALELNVWNPRSGPLCKFCPVTSCDHHRE